MRPNRFWFLPILIATSGLASADKTESTSPDGKYSICTPEHSDNELPFFVIRAKDGKVLYSSKEDGCWNASSIQWIRDGQLALFQVNSRRYHYASVFSVSENKVVYIYPEEERFSTVPIRWVNSRTFVVEISGPYTNARDPFIKYRKTYRVTAYPLKLESIYTGPKDITPPMKDDE